MRFTPTTLGQLPATLRLLTASVTLAILVSCGSSGTVRIEFATSSTVLNVGGTVRVVIDLTTASVPGPFALDTSDLPAGISASFTDATLGAAGDSSELILTASGTAAEGTFSLTVSAIGTQATGTANLAVTVELLDVSGVVLNVAGGPLAGASVVIDGHDVVTTGLDGSFSIDEVVVPYDITVFGSGDWAHVYQGVTTGSLRLLPLPQIAVMPTLPAATVQGSLSPVVPVDQNVTICAEGVGSVVYGCVRVFAGATSYSLPISWIAGNSVSLRLRAMRHTSDGTSLTASGAVDTFSISEGGTETKDITLAPSVTSVNFNVTVAGPVPGSNYFVNALTTLPSSQSFGVTDGVNSATGSGIAAVAPYYSGSTFALIAQSEISSGQFVLAYRQGLASGGTYTLTVPAAPIAISPADAATGVNLGTTFTTALTPGRVNTYLFNFSGSFGIAVTTAAESITIPNLAAHGFGLPSATFGNWNVLNSPDFTDLDTEVEGVEPGLVIGYLTLVMQVNSGGPALEQDFSIATSGNRGFTTAP